MRENDLPDFEDMLAEAAKIKELMLRRDILQLEIESGEANVYRTATSDTKYFSNGKAPSISHIKSVFEFGGFNNELISLRHEFATVCADLELARMRFKIMEMQVEIYRTESANKRASL
jgi:hypothetical protein